MFKTYCNRFAVPKCNIVWCMLDCTKLERMRLWNIKGADEQWIFKQLLLCPQHATCSMLCGPIIKLDWETWPCFGAIGIHSILSCMVQHSPNCWLPDILAKSSDQVWSLWSKWMAAFSTVWAVTLTSFDTTPSSCRGIRIWILRSGTNISVHGVIGFLSDSGSTL